jgi:predicted polyphosphate/ATP-dependent NAD kinase
MTDTARIGLVVNPLAGIGGALAAKGSDNFRDLASAIRAGGMPVAASRASRALARLRAAVASTEIVTAAGSMGEDVARLAGFDPIVTGTAPSGHTTAEDTRKAVAAILEAGVQCLVFAGGDGTARDVLTVIGDSLPVIGIPTGVKMHSAVFAVSPEAAGELAAVAAKAPGRSQLGHRLAEVMDCDEAERVNGRVSPHLYGHMWTPAMPRLLQQAKAARPEAGQAAIEALGRRLARDAALGTLTLIGPGTTMAAVKRAFGFEGTLLGVDALSGVALTARDGNARMLERLTERHLRIRIIVGVVGGQGFVFGRGNQQITPSILARVAREDLLIVATRDKLASLQAFELRIDTGDPQLDQRLAGYRRVHASPTESMMLRVSA